MKDPNENKRPTKRIDAIDALRGLAVILMVAHHFLYDCCAFLGASWTLFTNPVFDILHYVFAGTFVFLSGVSSRFSRSNFRRGIKTALCALGVTVVTVLLERCFGVAGVTIRFGILHLLAFCMLFYALVRPFADKLPDAFAAVLYLLLLIGSAVVLSRINPVGTDWFSPLGAYSVRYESADYFPILPWVFVFLLGTIAGKYIRDERLPQAFYRFTVPVLPAVGRHALLVYLLHQPVLFGVTMLLRFVFF